MLYLELIIDTLTSKRSRRDTQCHFGRYAQCSKLNTHTCVNYTFLSQCVQSAMNLLQFGHFFSAKILENPEEMWNTKLFTTNLSKQKCFHIAAKDRGLTVVKNA